ncbi:MAG: HDOD domain-containing protein [bacterium]|nr:HDOD domain-containing protein [bacterium]
MSRRADILAEVANVPALPVAAVKAIGVLQDPEADLSEIARVINHDPGLAANVLKFANAALFGARSEATSVDAAIARLGTRRVLDLVVGSAIKPFGSKRVVGYDLPSGALWGHSVAVACGVEELSSVLGRRLPDSAFTAGLLIDVGKHVLGTHLEIDGQAICDEAFKRGVPFEQAERHVLGVDHAEVGACLLEHWNLPAPLVSVVRWHHEPERCPAEHESIMTLVHASDVICTMCALGTGIDGNSYHPCESVMNRLELDANMAEAVIFRIVERLEMLGDIVGETAGST